MKRKSVFADDSDGGGGGGDLKRTKSTAVVSDGVGESWDEKMSALQKRMRARNRAMTFDSIYHNLLADKYVSFPFVNEDKLMHAVLDFMLGNATVNQMKATKLRLDVQFKTQLKDMKTTGKIRARVFFSILKRLLYASDESDSDECEDDHDAEYDYLDEYDYDSVNRFIAKRNFFISLDKHIVERAYRFAAAQANFCDFLHTCQRPGLYVYKSISNTNKTGQPILLQPDSHCAKLDNGITVADSTNSVATRKSILSRYGVQANNTKRWISSDDHIPFRWFVGERIWIKAEHPTRQKRARLILWAANPHSSCNADNAFRQIPYELVVRILFHCAPMYVLLMQWKGVISLQL